MRVSTLAVGFASTLLLSSTASAAELRYAWKKGDVHRYRLQVTTHFKAPPGRGAADEFVTVRSVFAERVLAARPDGSADIDLAIEELGVYLGKRSIGALDKLPPAARTLPARADRKGHMALRRIVAAYLHEGRMYLGVRELPAGLKGPGRPEDAPGMQSRARVDLFASFDPQTGRLSMSTTAPGKVPPLAAVQVKEEDPAVEAVPRQLFDMLEFPASAQPSGSAPDVRSPAGTAHWRLVSLEGPVATIRVTGAQSGDDVRARALLTGIATRPVRELADVTARFDTARGELVEARGTIVTRTSIKRSSRISLTRL